ncbi:MAG: ABC transporter permease, partial [Alphaproteobacteria bacterium]
MTTVSMAAPDTVQQPSNVVLFFRYLRRNKGLAIGALILLALTLFTVIGLFTVNPKHAYPLSAALKQPPSLKYPFGTDFFGRNLLVAMVVGMWQ